MPSRMNAFNLNPNTDILWARRALPVAKSTAKKNRRCVPNGEDGMNSPPTLGVRKPSSLLRPPSPCPPFPLPLP